MVEQGMANPDAQGVVNRRLTAGRQLVVFAIWMVLGSSVLWVLFRLVGGLPGLVFAFGLGWLGLVIGAVALARIGRAIGYSLGHIVLAIAGLLVPVLNLVLLFTFRARANEMLNSR